jgi:hypothetical protein
MLRLELLTMFTDVDVAVERALDKSGNNAAIETAMQATIKRRVFDEPCVFVISALLSNNLTFVRQAVILTL